MKVNLFNIVIVVALVALAFFVWDNSRDTGKLDEELKEYREREKELKAEIKGLFVKIAFRDSLIALNKQKVLDVQKSEKVAKNEANAFKKSYKQLLKEQPKNLRDSLDNYIARDVVSHKRIKSLEQALSLADSAIAIQHITIQDLTLTSVDKDSIIVKLKGINQVKQSTIDAYEKEVRKQKRKGNLKGIAGIAIGILLILI
jgi:hypothetical protein